MKAYFTRLLLSVIVLVAQVAHAQNFVVTGTVSDAKEPLVGASVLQKGTNKGTVTDINGRFTIEVPQGATLRVSFIGYVSQDVAVTSSTELNIILEGDEEILNEVVVIGYGTVKKSDLTGSVGSVKSEDFVNTAVSSLDQGLQGKVSG